MEISERIKNFSKLKKYGYYSFFLGIFFLPSALPISIFFLLCSIFASFIEFSNKFLKNRWNYPILILTGIIIVSCINNSLNIQLNSSIDREIHLIWLDLFNWIPLFLIFWSSQNHLEDREDRERFAKILLVSSIPVLLSCLGQYWFNIEGPFYFLKGLIVWFMKPMGDSRSMSGLFSNSNYLACWLSLLLPFSLVSYTFIKKKYYKLFNLIINLLIIYCLICTNSRNALGGIIIALTFLKLKSVLFSIIIILLLPNIIDFFTPNTIINFDHPFIPTKLVKKFINNFSFKLLDTIRFDIWFKSIQIISQRPFLGWGAASFPILYISIGGLYEARHTHNLPLQLAHNYGIPFCIILVGMITMIIFRSFNIIFIKKYDENNLINKAWFLSTIIIVFFHIGDIPYFDGKISLISWILIGGLCSLIRDYRLKIN